MDQLLLVSGMLIIELYPIFSFSIENLALVILFLNYRIINPFLAYRILALVILFLFGLI